jgi:hypothetical protein
MQWKLPKSRQKSKGASGEESDSEIEIDNARKGAEELATEVTVEDDTRTGGKELELEVEANTGASEDWRLHSMGKLLDGSK